MKKILLTLFVGFVGIISFCIAYDQTFTWNCGSSCFYDHNYNFCVGINSDNVINANTDYYLSCNNEFSAFTWSADRKVGNVIQGNGNPINIDRAYIYLPPQANPTLCFNFTFVSVPVAWSDISCNLTDTPPSSCDYSDYVSLSDYNSLQSQFNTLSGQYNTLLNSYNSCQSDLSSCQSFTSGFNEQLNYCNSELVSCNSSLTSCLQYNCPETELSYSKFYVRHGESTWFQLTGMENYYVYLPDYLSYNYDYSYGTDLNFTVGVATDTGYINNINVIQNSKPSQEDLNKLVSEVLPLFVPGLAVILLLYFIFRFIKKLF